MHCIKLNYNRMQQIILHQGNLHKTFYRPNTIRADDQGRQSWGLGVGGSRPPDFGWLLKRNRIICPEVAVSVV